MVEKCKVLYFESGKCFMQLYRRAGIRLLENDLTMKGYGRKRRSFGEINQMVIFRENIYKRDFLPISTEMYFREKVLTRLLTKTDL